MAKRLIKKSTIKKATKWLFASQKKQKSTKKITSVFEKPSIFRETISLNYGSKLIIPVNGECYGQSHSQNALKSLYKKYGQSIIDFSLAPQNNYQKEHKWPEEPFLNVLLGGRFIVSKENWLGYIAPIDLDDYDDDIHKDRSDYIEKLIRLGKVAHVTIKGKVIKEGFEYSVLLFASHKEIDGYLDKYKI
ncbi:hypothetical protein IJI94_02305 [Candidatus Saccharibacteria bacterium]|nr:hypothetical protein [Candidatus Saccharibacteria bacterium]